MTHPSDSLVQRLAEGPMLRLAEQRLGCGPLESWTSPYGAQHDGVNHDDRVAVEVFARIGKLEGSQRHKLFTDVARLRDLGPGWRLALAVSPEAAASLPALLRRTLVRDGVELLELEVDPETRAAILAAQDGQGGGQARTKRPRTKRARTKRARATA